MPPMPNASCTKDLLNAVTATPCSLAALCGLLLGRPGVSLSCTAAAAGAAGAAAEPSLLAQRLPALGLVACGITCGFFAADCVVLRRHGDELAAEMGRANVRLMWPHHLLSLIVWPYCAVYGRGGVFVLYFLSTELSSIFLASLGPLQEPSKSLQERLKMPPRALGKPPRAPRWLKGASKSSKTTFCNDFGPQEEAARVQK